MNVPPSRIQQSLQSSSIQFVSLSLRGEIKKRLLSLFENIQGDRKLIILDPCTVKVVDSLCMMNELLDTGAYLVETINKSRQPYPSMQAVYFLSPNEESIRLFISDFAGRTKPAYKEAHLFLTNEIGQDLFSLIAKSSAGAKIQTFLEVYIDNIFVESRVWHLGMPIGTLARFYNNTTDDEHLYKRTASQLTALCANLNIFPTIRYHKHDLDRISPRVAAFFDEQLKRYAERNQTFTTSAYREAEFIIIDRSMDLVAPLLHEFTYQAMAQDLLDIDQGNRYVHKYKKTSENTEQQQRQVALDENDSLWVAMRHIHIAECSKLIIEKFNTFLNENKAAMRTRSANGSSTAQVTSLSELREVMGCLGEFQELKTQYSLHLTIAQECMSVIDKKKLLEVANLEQDMATGLDSSGEPISPRSLLSKLSSVLANQTLDSKDRARLLILYLLNQQQTNLQDSKLLLERTSLEAEDLDSVRAYSLLSKGLHRAGLPLARKKEIEEAPYDVSRFTPQLKRLIREVILNSNQPNTTLNERFPCITGEKTSLSSSPHKTAPVSLRSRDQGTEQKQHTSYSQIPVNDQFGTKSTNLVSWTNDHPVFFFIVGGMTYSEIRTVYEVSNKIKRNFFVGSTHILRPRDYLSELAKIVSDNK